MKYTDYLQSLDWKQKRYMKRKRKNNCAICNSKKELHVHHVNYKSLYDVEMCDLRVLCKRCHFLAHDLMDKGEIVFTNQSHHSKFQKTKAAVKKALKISTINMFYSQTNN